MKNMDEITSNLLKKDVISESEKILGKDHYSEFTKEEEGFNFRRFINHNEAKRKHLEMMEDTYFGVKWNDFKELIKKAGFIEGYSHKIKETEDEYIIYYHPKGLILDAESYFKDSLNSGTCHGEIEHFGSDEHLHTMLTWRSSGGWIKDNVYETYFDVREGLFHTIKMLESCGNFKRKWINKDKSLWLVDYKERNEIKENRRNVLDFTHYDKITMEKIKKCPKELQDIIGSSINKFRET